MWRWSGGHVGSRPATHGSSLPYLVELGVPAISSSGHLCFLTPAVPNREEGWGSKGRCEESPAWSVSPWRQSPWRQLALGGRALGGGRCSSFTHSWPLCPAAVRYPVTRALLASPAPAPILATTGVSSRPPSAPAAARLAGWYEGGASGILWESGENSVNGSQQGVLEDVHEWGGLCGPWRGLRAPGMGVSRDPVAMGRRLGT